MEAMGRTCIWVDRSRGPGHCIRPSITVERVPRRLSRSQHPIESGWADVGTSQVELTVAVPQIRCVETSLLIVDISGSVRQAYLIWPCPGVADELPIDQVRAGVHWQSGDCEEARNSAEIRLLHADTARVAVPSRYRRVQIS